MASANHRYSPLTVEVREIFTTHAAKRLPEVAKAILEKLSLLAEQPDSAPEMKVRRDAWLAFRSLGKDWILGTGNAWKLALEQLTPSGDTIFNVQNGILELMDNEVIENKILASHLGLRILDLVSWELNDLRLRVQKLDNAPALESNDILRPEVLARKMIEQWTSAGLLRDTWVAVQDVIQNRTAEDLLEAYHMANKFLIQQGVMAEIDLRPLVKRTPSATVESQSSAAKPTAPKVAAEAHLETCMQTATPPLAKAETRALGVMGGMMRLLSNQVTGFGSTRANQASPLLAQALASMVAGDSSPQSTRMADSAEPIYGYAQVEQASEKLRQRTNALKKAASTPAEKATIEIVALMFQSILAEDRIPASVRVWFARLQIPVLRVALLEPDFFASLQHPARRLIDHMGSCVLDFDVDMSGGALAAEIKRIVQVIEQYPETGSRVFQLVYEEFQKFLSKFLSENSSALRVVNIAQQVEQKQTMAIQYTIEMRNMLDDTPVRDDIREFLFKTWADVLAIASMRHGPQHEQTLTLKRCAADLVWAASAKLNRTDRAKVIADLPKLLQLLRLGMSMLGMPSKTQNDNIKLIRLTLVDAFMSKTGAISIERIQAIAKRLTHLEDYLPDEDVGDLPLDAQALVMMIDLDTSDIEVVADGGSQPTEAMYAWADQLQLGSWFRLDHNGNNSQVQFAWRSGRKQLHLFASPNGRHFLIQARRLAAYLQAGLLLPIEEDALTVRATRDALAKLEANPERLLS